MDGVIDTELVRIGQRVRRWREEDSLTLQELAERSGLATSTIQKVETAQMIPSVAVLLKLARGLGRRASELIHDVGDEVEVLHLRSQERRPVGVPERMLVERLSGDLPDSTLEMWRVTLQPGVSSGRQPIQYRGEELVVCEKGAVVLRAGERDYLLRAGDALHLRASIPHSWRNEGEAAARFTVTGTLPRQVRALMQRRVARAARRRSA